MDGVPGRGRCSPVRQSPDGDWKDAMLLYTWPSANCLKVHIALEELALPYEARPVDLLGEAHRTADFAALDPNQRVPLLCDDDVPDEKPYVLADSATILIYLAEKTGRLLPAATADRSVVIQWLAFQAGGISTFCGEALHYRTAAPDRPAYAIERYTNEAQRHFRVLESRLAGCSHIAGDYSIADIAIFPWAHLAPAMGQSLEDYPNLHQWFRGMLGRPAVQKALDTLSRLEVPRDAARRASIFVAALDAGCVN
jgi:GSH-dependent disulfide-bond oxidoreductase